MAEWFGRFRKRLGQFFDWYDRVNAEAADAKEQAEEDRRAKKAAAREQAKLKGMVKRTCRNCGHVWYVPKGLSKAARRGTVAGALAPEYRTAGAILGRASVQMDTCVECGSVRFFDEQKA